MDKHDNSSTAVRYLDVHWQNCVYWVEYDRNITVEKAVNLHDVNVWCGLSTKVLLGLSCFEGTVIGEQYLTMLADSIFPAILQCTEDVKQQPVSQGSPEGALSDSGLGIELAIPSAPYRNPQDILQQPELGAVAHIRPSEEIQVRK
ncbi:hypothetical protein X975_26777, partial [Stegodyphus mimosarum]